MKYRRLNNDELKELEPEFVKFLAANTVTADDWVKLKENNPTRVEGLIELFSDIVFENILKKVDYLEYRETNDLKTFHCLEDKIIMMGLFVEGKSDLDFTKSLTPEQMMEKFKTSNADLKLYSAEKKYKNGRDPEIFKMMENGCLISKDGALFKLLSSLKS